MDTLYLVRHAKAGERRNWSGADHERPLSKKGWRQSSLLAAHLEKKQPTTLYSSHYVRCMQTLAPLADSIGVEVRELSELAEYEPAEPLIDVFEAADDRTVFCTHGDIIPAVIALLQADGAKLMTKPDWRKASTWVLKRNKRGKIVRAHAWPPPGL